MTGEKKYDILVYGCYGYTGKLIVELLKDRSKTVLLAGRNEEKVKEIAISAGMDYEVVDLKNQKLLESVLDVCKVAIHCAGPFEYTAADMVAACIKTKTHYLDITGELVVFEALQKQHQKAIDAGIMVLPGAGFDVVPSDCLAQFLKEKLPDATHLELAFANIGGGPSHGTTITSFENMHRTGYVRKNGQLEPAELGKDSKKITFKEGKNLWATSITWGDISTAWYSTKIPNIKVYMALPLKMIKRSKLLRYIRPVLKWKWVRDFVIRQIKKRPAGPSETSRANARSLFYGTVKNAKGEKATARLETIEGYNLTAQTAVLIAKKVLDGNYKTGYQTPSTAYSADLIMEIEGTTRTV